MNSPIHSSVEHAFVLLLGLRQYSGEHSHARYMAVDGFIQGLFWADVITNDQYQSLTRLASECFFNAGRPFPSPLNLGPVMPAKVAFERARQLVAPVGKPQALVAAHESDKQVPAPTAPRRLPVLGLLGECATVGHACSCVQRLPAAWVARAGRWPLACGAVVQVSASRAGQASAKILGCSGKHRQACAVCPDSAAIRVGGNC